MPTLDQHASREATRRATSPSDSWSVEYDTGNYSERWKSEHTGPEGRF